ncbi:hypothetical protein NVP1084O_115 [Vibrio phage 1.084.O._10N.261.49.F5]|nr:hypothetical protein NVP1084O_115 [Vibrio phage 1.084.O._10N.261.49.F5]
MRTLTHKEKTHLLENTWNDKVVKCFAWFPTPIDGAWVWLESYQKHYYVIDGQKECTLSVLSERG